MVRISSIIPFKLAQARLQVWTLSSAQSPLPGSSPKSSTNPLSPLIQMETNNFSLHPENLHMLPLAGPTSPTSQLLAFSDLSYSTIFPLHTTSLSSTLLPLRRAPGWTPTRAHIWPPKEPSFVSHISSFFISDRIFYQVQSVVQCGYMSTKTSRLIKNCCPVFDEKFEDSDVRWVFRELGGTGGTHKVTLAGLGTLPSHHTSYHRHKPAHTSNSYIAVLCSGLLTSRD